MDGGQTSPLMPRGDIISIEVRLGTRSASVGFFARFFPLPLGGMASSGWRAEVTSYTAMALSVVTIRLELDFQANRRGINFFFRGGRRRILLVDCRGGALYLFMASLCRAPTRASVQHLTPQGGNFTHKVKSLLISTILVDNR